MSFLERIEQEMRDAMRAKDSTRLSSLRLLKAALVAREVETKRALDARDSMQVVAALAKQRRESIEQFTKAGRQDLVERETAELRILEAFLPAPVEPAELDRIVDEVIRETGAASTADLGRVMKSVMARLEGRFVDGKAVNALVRRRLGGT